MGVIIKARDLSSADWIRLIKPIIYCSKCGNFENEAVSINVLLAEELINIQPSLRTISLEKIFNQILGKFNDGVIIKDFDVMFNPEYQVDLLRLMISANRKKTFSVIWPGKYKNGKLFYAEEGFSDFKVFRIEDYDITCIV